MNKNERGHHNSFSLNVFVKRHTFIAPQRFASIHPVERVIKFNRFNRNLHLFKGNLLYVCCTFLPLFIYIIVTLK